MRTVYIIFLLCPLMILKAQKQMTDDEKDRWIESFTSTVYFNKVSDSRRFILLNKLYRKNSDTVLVMDQQSYAKPYDTILRKNKLSFLTDEVVFASGKTEVELIDLKNKRRQKWGNVRKAETLADKKQFVVLDKHDKMLICDDKGRVLKSHENVQDIMTTAKSLYFVTSQNEEYSVGQWNGKKQEVLYKSSLKIAKIELLPSKNFIVVHEETPQQNKGKYNITIIKLKDRQLSKQEFSPENNPSQVKITEIKDSETLIVDFQKRVPVDKKGILEIWYANDQNLRNKKYGSLQHQYFVWNSKNNRIAVLQADRFTDFMGMNDSRYVWAFNTKEERNYVDSRSVNIYRYDIDNNISELIFENAGQMVSGGDRRFTAGYNAEKNQWLVYDHVLKTKQKINSEQNLRNPLFINDCSKAFLFESDNGLYKYELLNAELKHISIADNAKVSWADDKNEMIHQLENFSFKLRTAEAGKPIIVNVKRKETNETSYFELTDKAVRQLMPFTKNAVKKFDCQQKSNIIFTVEENFNSSQALYRRKITNWEKECIYGTNGWDNEGKSLKQDILHYKNEVGAPLKGVLYYPVNFDSSQKYPVVVHIYNILNGEANKYLLPAWGPNGFNKRWLLQNGYFVFEPDTVFDGRGTGLSALDCVNTGLDAIIGYKNIDAHKIGLMGHSLGGYETNFIATHSNRFAAYISGASLADIPGFYFSFSEHFKIANYSRFENGQFKMIKSYGEDSDLYQRNNPINFAERVNAPMLFWSGKKDTNVSSEQTMSFYMALLRNKKKAVVLLYREQEHSIENDSEEIKDLNNRTLEWWDYFLKNKKNTLWINQEMKRDAY